jgi:hypothetical protein
VVWAEKPARIGVNTLERLAQTSHVNIVKGKKAQVNRIFGW